MLVFLLSCFVLAEVTGLAWLIQFTWLTNLTLFSWLIGLTELTKLSGRVGKDDKGYS